MRSLRKRNATLCAILDMKLFNTDIIDTVADDKKLLIQGWCFKKSSQYCPKKRKLRDWTMSTSRIASQRNTVCFEIAFVNFFTFGWKDLFGVLRNLWNTDSADKFLFLKRKIILKTLIVLGLKYSKKFKKHTQSYTCFPIFEHFGC